MTNIRNWLFVGLVIALAPACGGDETTTAPVEESDENNENNVSEPEAEPTAEICDNGTDDDGDGLADCTDVEDCEDEPVCWDDETPEECGNGVDDDGDNLADCEDSDCDQEAACACDETVITGQGLFEASTAEGDPSKIEGSCGGAEGPEAAFLWTAPEAGTYTFDTLGSSASDTVLYLRDGGCLGEEIACNDDIRFAEVCDNEVDDDGNGDVDCDDPACALASVCLDDAPENCYNEEDDDGDELTDCEDDDCQLDPACRFRHNALTSIIRTDLEANQTVLIVVDGFNADEFGDLLVSINLDQPTSEEGLCDDDEGFDEDRDGFINCSDPDCADDPICDVTCPGTDLEGALGGAVASGNTDPESDGPRSVRNHSGQCSSANTSYLSGGRNAPEDTFSWTAPNNGLYSFDTLGSEFDTVIYVRDGDCEGLEIACNDDQDFDNEVYQSGVEVELSLGQTVTIFVDGFAYSSGEYVLNIDGPGPSSNMEVCDNEVDDDGDELADCDDPDCVDDEACSVDECAPNPIDPTRFVIVGTFSDDNCTEELASTAFPVANDSPCLCLSEEDDGVSADGFTCDTEATTFTYLRHTGLACGDDGTELTVSEDCLESPGPITTYKKITDLGACAP